MARDKQDITEAEMAVMQVLWRKAESPPPSGGSGITGASTRQIADEIYGERAGVVQYATVQKQLERLEAKGFVKRDRTLFVHLFAASVGRDELVGRRIREMADKLCEGSLAPVLSHLFKAKPLTERERRALRALIDDVDDRSAGDAPGARSGKPGGGSKRTTR
jgi:BlaI family transcriptional regulator, penicillinase repressor